MRLKDRIAKLHASIDWTHPPTCAMDSKCPMTLLYYTGGGTWTCWAHLLTMFRGRLIPQRILKTEIVSARD